MRGTGSKARLVLQRCGGRPKVLPDSRNAILPSLGAATVSWSVGPNVLTRSLTSSQTIRWRLPRPFDTAGQTGTAGRFLVAVGSRTKVSDSRLYRFGTFAGQLPR